jgi:hypothetical protein
MASILDLATAASSPMPSPFLAENESRYTHYAYRTEVETHFYERRRSWSRAGLHVSMLMGLRSPFSLVNGIVKLWAKNHHAYDVEGCVLSGRFNVSPRPAISLANFAS